MLAVKRIPLSLILLLWAFSGLWAQEIHWLSFEELNERLRLQPKPILIFIHTDWCKYCALQDHNTFGEKALSDQLNKDYYALRLNAETEETITFLNRKYEGGAEQYHELAQMLGKSEGQLIFPTTLLLSEGLQLKHRLTGFATAEELRSLLESFRPQVVK
jgi:thioredoxin-related protein